MGQAIYPLAKRNMSETEISRQAFVNGAHTYAVQPGWRLLIKDLGVNAELVLRSAKLPGDLLVRHHASLSSSEYFALWQAIEDQASQLPGPPVPLRIAQAMSVDWFDPVLFSALCSADLASALGRIGKYKRLICPMRLEVDNTHRSTKLTMHWIEPHAKPPPVLIAFEIAFFIQLARMATRTHVIPMRVVSPIVLEPSALYEAFLGTPVNHGAYPCVVFSAEDARLPFLTTNPALWAFFEPGLRQRLSDLDAQAQVKDRLRSALLEALPAGDASMIKVGRKMGMSSRTLQRRLQDEGTTFQRTLDEVRTELARHYLMQSKMSGAEISFLLGFEDPNSFFRAFHRWTGTTPREVKPTWQ